MGTNQKRTRRFWIQLIILFALCLASGLAWRPLSQWYADREKFSLHFVDQQNAPVASFKVDLATTSATRGRGLMFRQPSEMAPHQGMFFVFPDEAQRSFWMKNTYISLDILYLDNTCKIVQILENVPVLNEQPRPSLVPAQYVLELHAGTAAKRGLKLGHRCIDTLPVALE